MQGGREMITEIKIHFDFNEFQTRLLLRAFFTLRSVSVFTVHSTLKDELPRHKFSSVVWVFV